MELHNVGTYVLPQNTVTFLLGALPNNKSINRALGPVWQTSDKRQPELPRSPQDPQSLHRSHFAGEAVSTRGGALRV